MRFENISFIGGINGVGKSSICKELCKTFPMEHLTASEVLRWKDLNSDSQNKNVTDIAETQDRLIVGLSKQIHPDRIYLLDGHFCLFNKDGGVENLPMETFIKINPISLNIILGDVERIKLQLEQRDKRPYSYELLSSMQDQELAYANEVSKTLGVTLNIGNQDNYHDLIASLNKALLL